MSLVRSLMKPIECVHSLGGFNDIMEKEHKEEAIAWENEEIWV
jgi:hypothetical protein